MFSNYSPVTLDCNACYAQSNIETTESNTNKSTTNESRSMSLVTIAWDEHTIRACNAIRSSYLALYRLFCILLTSTNGTQHTEWKNMMINLARCSKGTAFFFPAICAFYCTQQFLSYCFLHTGTQSNVNCAEPADTNN